MNCMSDSSDQLRAAAEKLNVGGYVRHVFLCTGPSCCTPEAGLEAWELLKKELKERGLTNVTHRTAGTNGVDKLTDAAKRTQLVKFILSIDAYSTPIDPGN